MRVPQLDADAEHELDDAGRREALELLDRADQRDPLVAPLRGVFAQLEPRAALPPGPAARFAAAVRRTAERFAAWPGFATCLSWLFGVWALLSVAGVAELVFSVGVELGHAHPRYASDRIGDLAFVNVASLASSLLSALLVSRGVLRLRGGRRAAAYRDFERALLVAIFVTQVFAFVESQFGAVFGLGVDLLLLLGLRSLQSRAR